MVLGFSALFAYAIYNFHAMEDRAELTMQIASYESWIREINRRIISIEANALDENILDWTSDGRTTDEELNLLHGFKSFTQPRLDELKNTAKANDPEKAIRWMERAYVHLWLPFALAISVVIVIYGFLRWRRFQKVTDRLHDLDVQLKEAQLHEVGSHRRWRRYLSAPSDPQKRLRRFCGRLSRAARQAERGQSTQGYD